MHWSAHESTQAGADDLQSEYVPLVMTTSMVWIVWDKCVWPAGASKVFLVCDKEKLLTKKSSTKDVGARLINWSTDALSSL